MINRTSGRVKKRVIIIVAGAAVFIGGLGYYGYMQYRHIQDAQAMQHQVITGNAKQLDDIAFKGDRTLAAQYIERAEAGDHAGAQSVYDKAAANQPKTQQITLYRQAVMAAKEAHMNDDALYFMIELANSEQDYMAYGALADMYGERHQTDKQREYLQKAVNDLEKQVATSSDYQPLLDQYKQQLAKVGQ